LAFIARLCYFVNHKRVIIATKERIPSAEANCPCSLPQERSTPPCCPNPVSGHELFDLRRLMVDQRGDFPRRFEFLPALREGVLPGGVVSAQAAKIHLALAAWDWPAYFSPEARARG